VAQTIVVLFFGLTNPEFSLYDVRFDFGVFAAVIWWICFQLLLAMLPDILHKLIPYYVGGVREGSVTPAGHRLKYNINGLQAWIITHSLFAVVVYFNIIDATVIAKNWMQLFLIANVIGFTLSLFAYVKAFKSPSYPDDDKVTGIWYYDFVMGIEFNPRVFGIDMKLFFNGRPGIIGWTLINWSFATYQIQKFGVLTNSMILVNILQAIYVIDFFWNEDWYLRTIDISHDHFGWVLAFGDTVWLPFMYTLQSVYLTNNYVEISSLSFWLILILGLVGYTVFRLANYQKNLFRQNDPTKIKMFGRTPVYIECRYATKDGINHRSTLLISGLWGVSRHMNYTGDLLLSLAYCLACGFNSIVPYFYVVYMTILLVTRCWRDETRCQHKYGKDWETYCKIVPYRFIPYVY
jgi:7-dehydrocholesterol reductase